MIGDIIKKIFSNNDEVSNNSLETFGTNKKIRIAIATIMIEAVNADNNLSGIELSGIINLLKERFDLNTEESEQLIELSRKYRDDNPDIWYFTNLINEHLGKEDKYELIEMVWRVIYSDGNVDKYENSVSHKLMGLLHIEHSKFIEIKLKVLEDINNTLPG